MRLHGLDARLKKNHHCYRTPCLQFLPCMNPERQLTKDRRAPGSAQVCEPVIRSGTAGKYISERWPCHSNFRSLSCPTPHPVSGRQKHRIFVTRTNFIFFVRLSRWGGMPGRGTTSCPFARGVQFTDDGILHCVLEPSGRTSRPRGSCGTKAGCDL